MRRQGPSRKKIVLGVTGSFGSGKSTVARILGSYGAQVIDADRIAHGLLKPKTAVYKKIVARFGSLILKKNGVIDRKKLAGVVFGRRGRVRELNIIMHPEIIKIIKQRIRLSAAGLIVLDAPLLLEAGLTGLVDKVIVVKSGADKQSARLSKRMSLTRSQIARRAEYQIPLRVKTRAADFIIDNNGTIKETKKQVEKIWEEVGLVRHKSWRA